ncbi:hypothetical protein [Burkholderia cepacia]|uniref:hypothetical protein n=1 Tax=Burkholderia cepacia TaxID=292 RepID=UPI002AB70F5E|nr:hypothetical protein [Burkholderia cepacia]
MKITKPDFEIEAEKKLKVIWDLLKRKDAVKFRMTVSCATRPICWYVPHTSL